jgi:hypothetical protein
MSQTLSSLAVSGVLVGLIAGAVAFQTPEAQAACIGGDSVCTNFDPLTPSSPTNVGGFTGSGNNAATYSKARLRLKFTGTPVPITFSNFTLKGQGINNVLSFGDLTISTSGSSGRASTAFINLDSSLTGSLLDFSQNTISFTIPGISSPQTPTGISLGSKLSVDIQYSDSLENNINTSANDFESTSGVSVPGPLPLFGAGTAFAFSRRLRKRIKSADQA